MGNIIGEKCVSYLKKGLDSNTTVEDLVTLFEKMCEISIEEDMILFETGVFSFDEEPKFYFSLTRQYPGEEEEYYQIHMDIAFEPNEENKGFSECVWNEEIEKNLFDYVRGTDVYQAIRNQSFTNVDIYLDET